jgi:tetratricopeptide (TPR) repeat protein
MRHPLFSCDCGRLRSVQIARRQGRPEQAWLWCFLVIGLRALSATGQELPVDLMHLRQRAEEHYFDGEYDDAKRVLQEAEEWLDSPLNRRDLIALNFDHSMLDVFFSGFRAEVLYAMGDLQKAQGALRHAEHTLKNRRNRYAAARIVPPLMLQYEAFIEFVRGDLLQPVPDFGLSKDPGIPLEVQQLFLAKKPAESLAAYGRAESILGNPHANDGGGFFQRLEGRLLTSLARCNILKVGKPSKTDVTDCEALLNRAEAAFQKGAFWQQVINQANFARLPLTFKAVNEQSQNPAQRLGLKRQFAQTINDWAEIELLRAELTAYQEQGDTFDPEAIQTAERGYDGVVGFMKAQFGDDHASAQRVQLSRARWLVALARGPEVKADTRISYLEDCLSDLGKISKLSSGDMAQVQALELAAASLMLAANKEVGHLSPEDVAKLTARVDGLKKSLAARMER